MSLSEYDGGRRKGDVGSTMAPLPDTMIYTPENFRIVGDFAMFTRDDGRVIAFRLSTVESVTKDWNEEDALWEIKVYLATGKRYTFDFSALGNVFEHLIGA